MLGDKTSNKMTYSFVKHSNVQFIAVIEKKSLNR